MIIGVIGGEDCDETTLRDAEQVGRELALRGHVLVCGGRGGVMEAACRGARAEGGHTIGLLPGEDRSQANAYVEFPIVTGVGRARNLAIVLTSDALIAIDGAYGTLSEIAFAHQYGKPVVGLRTWTLSLAGVEDQTMLRASTPVEAVEMAVQAAQKTLVP
ncbi:MAG TPA: TIGR00725 family protein [Dehalococcoidia bacterium]|nr:TIGR00725 family protein [Dehalococcoidia bacterium]